MSNISQTFVDTWKQRRANVAKELEMFKLQKLRTGKKEAGMGVFVDTTEESIQRAEESIRNYDDLIKRHSAAPR